MSKTLGLALGSGGARGVAHVGFLLALEEEGIKPDYIAGCSMGAVVGGCYASGIDAKTLKKTVLNLKKRDVIAINPVAITQMSLLRSKKVNDLLMKHIKIKNIEEFPIPFKCVATDIYSGEAHIFDSGEAVTAIQASSTIPSVFRPVKLGEKLLVDGGCVCRVPARIVRDMGAEVVVAVDVLSNCSKPVEKVDNVVQLLLRVYDIMDARCTSLTKESDKAAYDLWLEPEMAGMSQYVIKDLDRAFEEGYALGKQNIQKIKELLEQ